MFKIQELLEASAGRLIGFKDGADIRGISTDSRTIKPGQAFLAIKGDNFNGQHFIPQAIAKGASCVICQPHLPIKKIRGYKKTVFIEAKDTTKALGNIARIWRAKFDIPLIAITGTSGKTTTKEMLSLALSAKYKVLHNEGTKNNHIGVPLTLLQLDKSHHIAVVELGTNHFGEIEYLSRICRPNLGIITNIGPGHLEYLHSLSGVFREKYAMLRNLAWPAVAILNHDDRMLVCRRAVRLPFFTFGIRRKSDFSAVGISSTAKGMEFWVNKKYKFTLPSLGYYNIYNALAAIAAARLFGLDYRDISRKFSGFDFPKGRLKAVKIKGIHFLDDTYNSNPLSLKEALAAMSNFRAKGRKILVMGDMLELGRNKQRYHELAGRQAAIVCQALVAVGDLSKHSAAAAANAGMDKNNIFCCRDSQEAGKVLFKKLTPDKHDIVLVKGSRRMQMERVLQ